MTRLKKGDQVALLAPSGPCDPKRVAKGAKALENFGLRPYIMNSCFSKNGYLAGSDAGRASDLMEAFMHPEVKGIFAIRGGYGAQRILSLLDYDLIAKNPKLFAGYSDITALHIAFNQFCGFITYHSPMPGTELYQKDIDEYTVSSFLGNIMEGSTAPDIPCTPLVLGSASGILTGGNLSLLASSLGTPYEIDTKDKILFIEEIQEEPYKIDRMLLQLKYAGKFNNCRAILLGSLSPETHKTIYQSIEDILIPLGIPIAADIPCGHCLPTATLPLGQNLSLTLTSKKAIITTCPCHLNSFPNLRQQATSRMP